MQWLDTSLPYGGFSSRKYNGNWLEAMIITGSRGSLQTLFQNVAFLNFVTWLQTFFSNCGQQLNFFLTILSTDWNNLSRGDSFQQTISIQIRSCHICLCGLSENNKYKTSPQAKRPKRHQITFIIYIIFIRVIMVISHQSHISQVRELTYF